MSLPTTGLMAILRGVDPDSVVDVVTAVHDAGFGMVEIPFNSPEPLRSIERAREHLGESCLVGAGTVLTTDDVDAVKAHGGQFVVSPNCNPDVVSRTVELGLGSYPGVATPSEALLALDRGATAIKVFPAVQVTSTGFHAWCAILPAGTGVFPVGGVGPDDFGEWVAAGATGFGIGSALYRPGMPVDEVGRRARTMVQAFDAAAKGGVR